MVFRPVLAFREAIHPATCPGGFMRLHRSFSATRAIAILGSAVIAAAAFTGPATAAAGVGTSASSTKVLTAQLGDNAGVLDLLLLGDEARSTIDPAVASPEAYARLNLLS